MTHIVCASCGWFGRAKRRRDQRAADAAHIAWAAGLVRRSA